MAASHLELFLLALAVTSCSSFYHQPTFLEPVYDEYGYEITGDRVLEVMAMKSTLLGSGQGFNYSSINYTPFSPPVIPPYLTQGAFTPDGGRIYFSSRSRPVQKNQGPQVTQYIPYGPRSNQSPVISYNRQQTTAGRPQEFSPFHHRVFRRSAKSRSKRQSRNFPVNSLLDHLSRVPLDIPFGPQPDFGPSPGPFIDTSFPGSRPSRPGAGKACRRPQSLTCNKDSRYRTVDGLCNNLINPKWGAAMQPFVRLHRNYYYYDGIDVPRMTSAADPRRLLPSARLVSRIIHEPDRDNRKIADLTSLVMQWGQFLDHDITGTPAHKGADGDDLKCCDNVYLSEERQIHNDVFNGGPCNPIYIPPLDRHFRYSCMNFARSQASPRKSDCNPRARKEPREQMNMLTAFIDASQVYGSTLKENRRIRLYRHGMLQVTPLDLLPNDKNSTCVKDGPGDYCFLAGEMRVNEHPSLSTLHTIFHRLHNQMALGLFELNPNWSDEKIFQEARKIMGAVMQHVTYHDWLPIILGDKIMQDQGLSVTGYPEGPLRSFNFWYYDETANPTVINAFATAAFRFGHTLIPSKFTVGREKIRLFRMFNRPRFVLRDDGRSIGKFCSGLMEDHVQRYDRFIVNDLSDLLFQDRDNISMDLASLNIQRARDHGLPGYNEYREVCGMHRIKNFEQFYREDPERAVIFRRVYDHVDDIDLFPAGVSERSLPGAVVGSTFACIISQQFRNLKFGDRYWYENQNRPMAFTPDQLREIRSFTLSKILCTMAPLQKVTVNPFYSDGYPLPRPVRLTNGEMVTRNRYVDCNLLTNINLRYWQEP